MNTQSVQLNVPFNFTQVLDIVMNLSASEKRRLSEVLLKEQYLDIPKEHKQIVQERIKKYENNSKSYLSWEDIDRKMAERK